MLNNVIKTHLLLLMLAFCANLYADSYNVTINIDGEEYYSDENGFSDEAPVPAADEDNPVSTSDDDSSAGSQKKKKYAKLVAEAADKHQVDRKLVDAVIQAESAYNSKAVSRAGAVGLMQLMPGTARQYGVTDRSDPVQNIEGGTRYLKHLLDLFGSNLKLTLAAYNAGENAVIRNNNSIPPYAETRNYVKQVLSLQKGIKRNDSGPDYNLGSSDPFKSWGSSDYLSEEN